MSTIQQMFPNIGGKFKQRLVGYKVKSIDSDAYFKSPFAGFTGDISEAHTYTIDSIQVRRSHTKDTHVLIPVYQDGE